MKPAEKVALLKALIAAAEAELTRTETDTLLLADAVGVKTFTTPFGQVTIGQKDAKPMVTDPTAFMAWVRDTYPTEVETIVRVRPAFQTAVLGSIEWDKDLNEFVHPATGTFVPGIRWSEAGQPYVTWPSSTEQKRTKAEAVAWFADRSQALLATMTPALETK